MATQLLNLPINVPWKLIHQSPDMMDVQFCNKRFPFEWRSSLAISVFEPKAEDLPEDLCEGIITYIKVTCTITGYQPTKAETDQAYNHFLPPFGNVPTEGQLDDILRDYWACYGVLLNVAVFPFGATKKQLDPVSVDFTRQHLGDVSPNPLRIKQVTFQAARHRHNNILDITLQNGEQKRVLDLRRQMNVTLPATPRVGAKVVHRATAVTMEAYKGTQLVGSQTTGPEQNQIHELTVEGEDIDRVIFKSPENEGFLVEFTHYVARDVPVGLKDFPHIIDFEPKTRDLYQSATEDGELLTASTSEVKTDKSFTHGESSETGVSVSGTVGYSAGQAAGPFGSITGALSHKWGETNQDSSTTQVDSSRERREKNATTTNLSQMYNLLTGYHPGTNRAVFLMLPRPHVLQPTDHRTFVQGLRYIEGVQDFFLIVARPKEITGLCIEAALETGHFPEDVKVEEPPAEFDEDFEDFAVEKTVPEDTDYSDHLQLDFTYNVIRNGFVVDTRTVGPDGRPLRTDGQQGDPGHTGVKEIRDESTVEDSPGFTRVPIRDYFYGAVGAGSVKVSGVLGSGDLPEDQEDARFRRIYRVLTRSEQPKSTSALPHVGVDPLLITSRCLCVCFKSGKCPEVVATPPCPPPPPVVGIAVPPAPPLPPEPVVGIVVPPPSASPPVSIVDERIIEIDPALLTRDATSRTRLPVAKEMLRKIQFAMTSSGRLRTRLPVGEVGFLDTDYFKDRIKQVLPPAVLGIHLAGVPNLPAAVVTAFGGQATVADALVPDLASFARKTGLTVRDAANARFMLLTAKPRVVAVQSPAGGKKGPSAGKGKQRQARKGKSRSARKEK